jgi:hypothetical protein
MFGLIYYREIIILNSFSAVSVVLGCKAIEKVIKLMLCCYLHNT